MKQFENGQKVIVEHYQERIEMTYIGRMPEGWGQLPHCVQNNVVGFLATDDEYIYSIPVKREGWMNVYTSDKFNRIAGGGGIFKTYDEAKSNNHGGGYINTVRVEWEE
jgi:hypothetical protein